MLRRALLPVVAASFVACAGDAGPDLTYVEVVDSAAGAFDVMPSPDGRLAWAQPVEGRSSIHVANADGSSVVRLTSGPWDYMPVWSPDGQWIAYGAEAPAFDVFVVPGSGGEPRQLTSGVANDEPAGWLPDGSGVVFHRRGAGDARTLVVPLDGGPVRPLAAPMDGNQFATPSPDGSKVAFDLHRGSEGTIWVQDLAGGPARQLTSEGLENALPTRHMWSPDGTRLVFVSRRTGTWDLWTADVETGELRQLTSDVRNDEGHAWSPDGRWIAFVSDRGGQRDIWIVPSDSGAAIRVTNDLAREEYPEWSADGRTLFYERDRAEGGIGVTAADGGEPRILFRWSYAVIDATLSPDGATVLFTSDRSGNFDIWSVPLAGGEPAPLAVSPLEDHQAQVSPDGSRVAFTSNRTGSYDVWVMPAAGGEPRRLTEWPSDEYAPRWSPDGSLIAFTSNRETTQEDIWVVPADGGTPRRVTRFDAAIMVQAPYTGGARWSPDGQSLYVVVAAADGAALYHVPVSGGRPQALEISPNAVSGTLSPDGSLYAYHVLTGGWGFTEVTPTDGGPPRRITRRTEQVYQPLAVWSPDGTRLAVLDWTFDDATGNVLELSVRDTTGRLLTSTPRGFERPVAYTPDGRVVFIVEASDVRIMSVRVEELLAGR